jgi:hypothetical protein
MKSAFLLGDRIWIITQQQVDLLVVHRKREFLVQFKIHLKSFDILLNSFKLQEWLISDFFSIKIM